MNSSCLKVTPALAQRIHNWLRRGVPVADVSEWTGVSTTTVAKIRRLGAEWWSQEARTARQDAANAVRRETGRRLLNAVLSDPTPAEIAAACERIQAGWSDFERERRLRCDWREDNDVVRTAKVADLTPYPTWTSETI